jgi:starch synthase (maltosyl-transferring)
LRFYNAWNDNILYYGKATKDLRDFLLFAVNLDPRNPQGAHFEVPLWEFGLPDEASIEVDDLANGQRFTWTGKVQHVYLDPAIRPYAIWRLHGPGGAA